MEAKPIELALQGGGAHGAFTWGVLDRLLEDRRLRIAGISGTSAGAMNAVALVDGFQRGGADGAREALAEFWRVVSDAARFSPFQRTPLDRWLGRWGLEASPGYLMADLASRLFSPYDVNPFGLDPLRALLVERIDFDRVNRCDAIQLFVTATSVRTGRAKIFRQPEITADAVLASACLPLIFQAVEIDGEEYWDGGYAGNPALFPLVDDTAVRDLIVVQVNPIVREDPPRRAQDIHNRLNEITFNGALLKELRAIALLKELIERTGAEDERYRDMLLHVIHGEEAMAALDASSKLNAEWSFLEHLRDMGRAAAGAWLDANFDSLGRESSFDLDALFDDGLRPPRCGRS